MRRLPRAAATVALILGACMAVAPSASSATSLAYLEGKELYVSTLDGTTKARLSNGEGDWRAVAQNDQGWIVGVQLEADKIATLSRFTVWNPQGEIVKRGPLDGKTVSLNAYPLGLNITADGGLLVYGFSEYTYGFPVGSLYTGFYVLSTDTKVPFAGGPPLRFPGAVKWPSLVGNRVIGSADERSVGVQQPATIASGDFDPWFDLGARPSTYEIHDLNASADGSVVALEIVDDQPTDPDEQAIMLWKHTGLGGTYVDDCYVDTPVGARPQYPQVSGDGTTIAWQDTGGIKIAGVPKFNGPAFCELTAPPRVFSASASYPSLGGFDVAAYVASKAPAPSPTPAPGGASSGGAAGGATPQPITATATAPTLSSASRAAPSIKVTTSATGTATITLTILPKALGLKGKTPIVLGTASAPVVAGKPTTFKLKLTKRAKTLKRRLKGKKATLTVTIAGSSTTSTVKLK